jgi:hypothetical protein
MNELTIIALSFLAELLELSWQYSSTLKSSLEKISKIYQKSPIFFLLLHTGYIFIIYFSLKFEILNFPLILAITLKIIDIFFKIEMIKFYQEHDIGESLENLIKPFDPTILYLISLISYPSLIYWAIHW